MSHYEPTPRNNVTAALRSVANTLPVFSLHQVTPIGKKFARIVGTISAKASPEQVRAAISKLNNKITPVAGSFQAVASNGVTQSIEGIVGILEERVVLSPENESQFTAVAANMYMDDEERLWSMKKTDAGQILIKSHAGDDMEIMSKLMTCVASSTVYHQEAVPAVAALASARSHVEGGDLIHFVNPNTGVMAMAFAVASHVKPNGEPTGELAVIDRDSNVLHMDRELVVACVKASNIENDETEEMVAVAAGNYSLEFIADYYKKMFMRRPEYFAAFWSRFSKHAFA